MSRSLWGEIENDEDKKLSRDDRNILLSAKKPKFDEVLQQNVTNPVLRSTLKVKNPLVTQTIEVMKQTEMLQSLIETYSNKSDNATYLLNPCQMIPEVDFPRENAANLVSEDKFQKPIWFIPSLDTKFSRGEPPVLQEITSNICRLALRKAICGQLRVGGFTDTTESALILFADAIDEFMRSFMEQVIDVSVVRHQHDDIHIGKQCVPLPELRIIDIEAAYREVTNTSIIQVHNYYKHYLIKPNRREIAEFQDVHKEYDKLMKESQSMQRTDFQDNDLLNILEIPSQNTNDAFGNCDSNSGLNLNIGGIMGPNMVNEMLHELHNGSSSTASHNSSNSTSTLMNIMDNGHSNSSSSMSTITHNGHHNGSYTNSFD